MEILFVVALVLMFWLLLIRPAQRRQKQQLQLQNSLEAGSNVMLTSGIFGTLTDVTDPDRLRLLIAPGVEIEIVRGAVASVIPDDVDDPVEDDLDDREDLDELDERDGSDADTSNDRKGDGSVDLGKSS